jgi:hypothetical protein
MTDRDSDDRCWNELTFAELAAEAGELAARTGDSWLAALAENLRCSPRLLNADAVIMQIEAAHAS